MKCARLNLQERTKIPKAKVGKPKSLDKPRRYCQKRLINPEHEEDPRWTDVFKRFHCNEVDNINKGFDNKHTNNSSEDLCLTVQTLKFIGDVDTEQVKRPKTSFKYKTIPNGNKHRMFVKQPVVETDLYDDERSSQMTCYYFDDYVKYLFNSDRSRPNSGKSSIFLRGYSASFKENKTTQIDIALAEENKEQKTLNVNLKSSLKKHVKEPTIHEIEDQAATAKNSKITYRNTGRRKSLTISRTQSPETVQVIRVDVVCNNVKSSPDCEDPTDDTDNDLERKNEYMNLKNTHFADKYLLTNTVKSLDQNLTGGAKVTLLCKTFKLADRAKMEKPLLEGNKKHVKSHKDAMKNDLKIKNRRQFMK